MHFALVITSAPYSSQGAMSAYHTAQAILAAGHTLYRLFFLDDGVHNASSLIVAPQDDMDLPAAWAALIRQHDLDAIVCVASALKRGILSEGEALRYERGNGNLLGDFSLGGLGQYVDACQRADRVLSFGG